MEEVVLAAQEDLSKMLEVVGHHVVLCRALAQGEQGVNVLDAAESLLPELEPNEGVELGEGGVETMLGPVMSERLSGGCWHGYIRRRRG